MAVPVTLALVASSLHLDAQERRTLERGDRVRVQWMRFPGDDVVQRSGGLALLSHPDSLQLRPSRTRERLSLTADQIVSLERVHYDYAGTAALGAGALGAAGLLFGWLLTSPDGGIDAEVALVLGGGGALVGAVLGLILPEKRWVSATLPPRSLAPSSGLFTLKAPGAAPPRGSCQKHDHEVRVCQWK
jgi:hypothetical protein